MEHPLPGRRPVRPRSSQYRLRPRLSLRAVLAAALVMLVLFSGLAAARAYSFLHAVVNLGNPLQQAQYAIEPPAGSLPWKLKHAPQVNLLLLGYGGDENDAPYLTDSMMIVSIQPASGRVVETSIPRDLVVPIDAWTDRRGFSEKINAAYEIGIDDRTWPGKRSEFTRAKTRGGRLAEQTVTAVTGLRFDGYLGMDFKAFRDLVNALGGVQICMDTALDDNEYPDYHDGYVRGGIHFAAGCQQVDGEQALRLARSRHAVQPQQASDFGRSRRQQLLLNSIRGKASSVDALPRAPALMDALQKNVDTDMELADLKALYDISRKLPDNAVSRVALTSEDLLDGYYLRRGTCGELTAYSLCAIDPTFKLLHSFFANLFVDPAVLKEAAPVQVANASFGVQDLGQRATRTLQPLGFHLEDPVRVRTQERSYVYDYSGGRYPLTAKWMAAYFDATLVTPSPTPAASAPAPTGDGLFVVLGRDYALRWLGQG